MGISANARLGAMFSTPQIKNEQPAQKQPQLDNDLLKKKEEQPAANPFDFSQAEITSKMASFGAPMVQSAPSVETAGTMAYTGGGAETAGTMASAGAISSINCMA